MNIKIKNGHIQALVQVLDSLQLAIKPNRMRTRFVRMLAKREMEVVAPDKKIILEEFCTKDKDNKPLMKDREKGIYLFEDPEEEEKATLALQELLEEEFVISLDEYNKDMLLSVAHSLIEDDTIKVSGLLAELVDSWIDMFEEVINFYEKEDKKGKNKKKK